MNTAISKTTAPNTARRQRTIQGALPLLARAIGRRANVEVRIGGTKAFTKGRRIHLPTLPFEDPAVEILAFGFTEHEAAHLRYTEDVDTTNELHHRLWNTIEDIRCERALGRDYPGFATDLSRLVTKLVEDGELARPSQDDPPGIKLRQYLRYRLRAEVLQQRGLADYAVEAEAIFRQSFPAGACIRLGSVIGRVPLLRSSQEVADLAGEMLVILKEESEDPPPPPVPPAEAGQSGGNDPMEGVLPGTDSGLPGEAPDTKDTASSTDAQGRALLRELLQDAAPQLGADFSDVVRESLQQAAHTAVQNVGGLAGGFGRADAPIETPPGDPAQILFEVREASMALRTRLASLVESVRYARRTYSRHGSRISPPRLVRAMLGDARIFQRKIRPQREVNTAVEILCDRSGSMRGDRMRIAARSTLAAASGLSGIRGIATEIALFPGAQGEVEVLTQFNQSLRATATRYGAITSSGGTPMYEALLWGFERLLMRSEPRKMLLCLTDGQPPLVTVAACRQCIAAAMAGGIEVYAIGIQVPDITNLFPIARSIDDESELAQAMFDVLQGALIGPRAA